MFKLKWFNWTFLYSLFVSLDVVSSYCLPVPDLFYYLLEIIYLTNENQIYANLSGYGSEPGPVINRNYLVNSA